MIKVRKYNHILVYSIFLIFVGLFQKTYAFVPEDSLKDPDYIASIIKYTSYYPFIRYNVNFIEWVNSNAISSFFDKLSNSRNQKVKILHIGDSHVQADIGTGYLRNRFQQIFGYGGRGLVFPYRAANTHSAWDYRTFAEGNWENSKNIDKERKFDIGISGVTIYTTDTNAGFKFVFQKNSLPENFNLLKLLLKNSPESFDLNLKASSCNDTLYIPCYFENNNKFIEVKLPKSADTLYFLVNKTKKQQNFLEFYGLFIESSTNDGILYSSTGINGAGYNSILSQNLFIEQLSAYDPDLVIIDLGGNDFYKQPFAYSKMETMLHEIIKNIKVASPNTAIIINSSQNFYRKTYNVAECEYFSELTRSVAFKNNCAFYDYYRVAGENKSMMKWLANGLAKKDKVHLTDKGYQVKAELFLNAILMSYQKWLRNNNIDTLIAINNKIDSSELVSYFDKNIIFKKENVKVQVATETKAVSNANQNYSTKGQKLEYVIKQGDNLGSIAQKYHVTVNDLKKWNNLSTNKIIAGKKLIIYSNYKDTNDNKSSLQDKKSTSQAQQKIKHEVKPGENLWVIAKRYNTTVDKIKQLNNLTNDNLKPGMILIIK